MRSAVGKQSSPQNIGNKTIDVGAGSDVKKDDKTGAKPTASPSMEQPQWVGSGRTQNTSVQIHNLQQTLPENKHLRAKSTPYIRLYDHALHPAV